MAGSIAKAYVQVIPSAEGIKGNLSNVFNSEMPSAGQSAGGIFGSNLVGKIKGLIAAAGIGKILSDSLQSGAALQQSLGGIETLFKDSAATVIANAEKAYKTAGMSANDYMEQVTSFSASLLQSLGGDTEAAAAAADMALKDMADNANKMGTDMERITDAYQGFAKQNYTMLDNLKLGYGGTKTEMERLLADAQKISKVEYDINNLNDVYQAIHVIQGELGITGATADEAKKTFSGSMASMKAAFSDLMANLATGRDIGPSLAALGETFFIFFQNNLVPMVGNIFSALPATLSSLFGMAIQGMNLIADNADSILQMGIDLVTGIGGAIISALPYLAEAALNIVTSLGTAILSTDWIQLGSDTINSLRGSLDQAAAEILGTDGNIVQSVIDAIGSKLPDLLENGGTMVNQIVDGILGALPGLVDSALNLCVSFINMLVSNLPDILQTGKKILLNLIDGIRQTFPQILLSAGDAVAKLLSGLVQNLPKILAAGFDLIVSLIKGIGNAMPNIITAAGDVAKKIWNAIKNINWIQVGKDIINGLINGIGAMASALWDAAKNIASSALNAIKSFFGIASPSKVMRDEVGKWIPPGIAVGIEANTQPLTKALHDVSTLTTDSMQADMQVTSALTRAAVPPVSVYKSGLADTAANADDRIFSVLEDIDDSNSAILDNMVSLLKAILSAVLNIRISDKQLFEAVKREADRYAKMTGGYPW